jgi:NADH-quinone oxidoreductase subunit J
VQLTVKMKNYNLILQKFTKSVSASKQPFFTNPLLEIIFLVSLVGPLLLVVVGEILSLSLLHTVAIGKDVVNLYLPLTACVLALAVVLLRNPMYALLSLIGVFVNAVIIYIASGAVFLGLVFLIVYVGAVAILFLFVIMLLNVKSLTAKREVPLVQHTSQLIAVVVLAALSLRFLIELLPAINHSVLLSSELLAAQELTTAEAVVRYVNQQAGDVFTFYTLYTDHGALFLLITYILLIAMLGAIVLATKAHEEEAPIKGPRSNC